MKIYFAGSITGGREKVKDYQIIVNHLEKYGEVLTKHVADPKLSVTGEKNSSPEEIYLRDKKWLDESDILFAEITNPSLGVGYEIGYAEAINKKIICMHEKNKKTSSMICGNKNLIIFEYSNVLDLLKQIAKYMKENNNGK